MRALRIAVVEPEGRGGMAHYAYQLCRALDARGAEVTLVTDRHYELQDLPHPFHLAQPLDLWDPKPRQPRGDSRSPLRRFLRGLRYLRQWFRLGTWLRRRDFDVIQLGDIRFPILWPFLRRITRGPARVADVCHNVQPFAGGGAAAGTFRSGGWSRFVYRRIYRSFDHVFVHYQVNRALFLETYGLPRERVTAIPLGHLGLLEELRNSRDSRVSADDLRRHLDLPAHAPVVLLFGTLAPYKGVDLLIEAFSRLGPPGSQARLVVAGFPLPGFDLERERRRAAELGVAERVRFVPEYLPSSEVAGWMELAAVAAFPYRSGSQSAAVETALTFGVPVVASNVGAMAEMLGPEPARLVPPEDPAALAAALEEALSEDLDGPERRRRAEASRRRHGWEIPAEILLTTYGREVTS